MRRLCLLRHLPTDWNRERRLQGRRDQPLSAQSRPGTTLSLNPEQWRLLSSPLSRCLETARLTFLAEPEPEPALVEMDWGDYEGCRLADLRREAGETLAANEARGLDFRPPGGESPRDVQQRLKHWLAIAAKSDRDILAVTHKGVIRACYALATEWDMTADAPDKPDWTLLQCFMLDAIGRPAIDRLNARLESLQ
ncbi:MAG: histidine phosphatase family protein [Rhodospirillales bacterium]